MTFSGILHWVLWDKFPSLNPGLAHWSSTVARSCRDLCIGLPKEKPPCLACFYAGSGDPTCLVATALPTESSPQLRVIYLIKWNIIYYLFIHYLSCFCIVFSCEVTDFNVSCTQWPSYYTQANQNALHLFSYWEHLLSLWGIFKYVVWEPSSTSSIKLYTLKFRKPTFMFYTKNCKCFCSLSVEAGFKFCRQSLPLSA